MVVGWLNIYFFIHVSYRKRKKSKIDLKNKNARRLEKAALRKFQKFNKITTLPEPLFRRVSDFRPGTC